MTVYPLSHATYLPLPSRWPLAQVVGLLLFRLQSFSVWLEKNRFFVRHVPTRSTHAGKFDRLRGGLPPVLMDRSFVDLFELGATLAFLRFLFIGTAFALHFLSSAQLQLA
jgi:hypothetical protein